jgi:hypothetical protein
MVTLNEFVLLVRDRVPGVHVVDVPGKYGPNGPSSRRYLVRELANGTRLHAQLPAHLDGDEVLAHAVARTALENLDLEPRDFGF